jgi:hypothetical protein
MVLMNFTIEVLYIDGGVRKSTARFQHDAIAPKWMKAQAQAALNDWKNAAHIALEYSIASANRFTTAGKIRGRPCLLEKHSPTYLSCTPPRQG